MSADMATGSSAALQVPQFSGENYQIWVVKMKSYLKSFGLWEYVAEDKQVPALRANPTIAQIKQYEEEKMKKDKAVTCLHSALTDSIFTSIMDLETAKSIWDELKNRFEGSERVKSMKLLTLKREFENLKMKDSETVKDYSSKLPDLVNQMRLYGEVVEDYNVVEKMLISLPEKFEAKVAAIEESCDLKKMTISEMVSILKAQEQRHALRNDGDMEKTFLAMNKGKHKGKGKMDAASSESGSRVRFPPCTTCKRTNHLAEDCWHKGNHKFNAHSATNGDIENSTANSSKINKFSSQCNNKRSSLCNKLTTPMIMYVMSTCLRYHKHVWQLLQRYGMLTVGAQAIWLEMQDVHHP
ncbi:hypothetical protein EZV62_018673 [Acer yangbiense]|uniref:Uncharacterized protein n=1 Tax=Acer yangbiense TaxID=1000413 RepID=A0A5C7HK22_9ROSI|nr:hypothetical protein EZV62_018673 [Acer yangbiense]